MGKRADILIVQSRQPRAPCVPSSVQSWYTMTFQGRNVETVLVDGKVVVKDGRMTTVNEDEVAAGLRGRGDEAVAAETGSRCDEGA